MVKTEEAWALPEKGHTTTNSATVLGAIGEFNVPFTCCSTWSTLSQLVASIILLFLLEGKVLKISFSEKKLMPMVVLSASIVYIGVAATFYFDLI